MDKGEEMKDGDAVLRGCERREGCVERHGKEEDGRGVWERSQKWGERERCVCEERGATVRPGRG